MTITEYAKLYRPMKWTYKGETYSADIKKYLSKANCSRITNAVKAQAWMNDAIQQSKTVKRDGSSITAENPDGAPKVIDKRCIEKTFSGTASPSQIRDTLWLATHLGLITNDKTKTSKTCELPQDYADYYLGMECKGFALNYLGTPEGSVERLDDRIRRRKEPREVQEEDIMLVSKPSNTYHHIAIVTRREARASLLHINTVEAYGFPFDGLPLAGICSPYPRDLVTKAPGVFQQRNPGPDEFYFVPSAGHPASCL